MIINRPDKIVNISILTAVLNLLFYYKYPVVKIKIGEEMTIDLACNIFFLSNWSSSTFLSASFLKDSYEGTGNEFESWYIYFYFILPFL